MASFACPACNREIEKRNMGHKPKKRICETAASSSELVDSFLASHPRGPASGLIELWRHWEMVMGPELAALAYPLGAKGNILLVGAEDNFVLQELSFLSPEILERANAFMETEYFAKVELGLLQGRATLDAAMPLIDGRNKTAGEPLRRAAAGPAPGPLGKLDIAPDSLLGKLYWKYVGRFGKRDG